MKRAAHRRGFTLIEMLVAVAVIAIVAGLAVPNFFAQQRRAELGGRSRELVAAINLARGEAATGRDVPGLAGVPVVQTGIRFVSPSEYQVFVDDDNDSSNVTLLRAIALDGSGGSQPGGGLLSGKGGTTVRIESVTIGGVTEAPPSGIEFRFRRNGTLTMPVDVSGFSNAIDATIRLRDPQTDQERVVDVTFAGQATIDIR